MVGHLKSLAGAQNSLKDVGAVSGGALHGAATFVIQGTYSWVVPEGVTEVAIVCVGSGAILGTAGESSSVSRGATTLCLGVGGDTGDTAVRDGGGDAGTRAAGGYSGDGNSGTGGAPAQDTYAGGGVGLWGEGPSGTVGTTEGGSGGEDGYTGNVVVGGNCGGGVRAAGGGVSYANSVATTPGETLTVVVGAGKRGNYASGSGGVNIVWGRGPFPNLDGLTVTASSITIGDPA